MGASVIGFILGLLAGAVTGTEVGAYAGAAFGLLVGLTVHVLLWMRAHAGNTPTAERHLVMCTPYGQQADCEFVGDAGTGRWYDVQRCSLLDDPTHVDCDKGCVRLMSIGRERPGGACSCR